MSARNGGLIALFLSAVIFLAIWTIFGYAVLIAAFVALEGGLKVLMGLYIVGSLIIFAVSLFVRSAIKTSAKR